MFWPCDVGWQLEESQSVVICIAAYGESVYRCYTIISARPRAAEYTIRICKEKLKKPKVSKWLIASGSQCKHCFHRQCRKPFILKSRRSLAVLRPGQLILLFQSRHGLAGILHLIVSGFNRLIVRCYLTLGKNITGPVDNTKTTY